MQYDDQLLEGDEPQESFTERHLGLSTGKFAIASGFVLILGIYLGIIFFGNNSLEVLLELEEYENFLINDIERLKVENAALQKQYFELKELDADTQVTQPPTKGNP